MSGVFKIGKHLITKAWNFTLMTFMFVRLS